MPVSSIVTEDQWTRAWEAWQQRLRNQTKLAECLVWRIEQGAPCKECNHPIGIHGLSGCYGPYKRGDGIIDIGGFCICREQGIFAGTVYPIRNPDWCSK